MASPTKKMPNPSAHGLGERMHTTRPTIDSSEAPIMAGRSPMRDTSQPLGMSPTSSPTIRMAEIRPARARLAPRFPATIGIIGMTAPSPIENSSVGSSAGSARLRQRNGVSAGDIESIVRVDGALVVPWFPHSRARPRARVVWYTPWMSWIFLPRSLPSGRPSQTSVLLLVSIGSKLRLPTSASKREFLICGTTPRRLRRSRAR